MSTTRERISRIRERVHMPERRLGNYDTQALHTSLLERIKGIEGENFVIFAADLAIKLHHGQMRKIPNKGQDGKEEPVEYVNHVLRVTIRLINDGFLSPFALATALLHDGIEDTDTKEADIVQLFSSEFGKEGKEFGIELARGVKALSKEYTDADGEKKVRSDYEYYGNLRTLNREMPYLIPIKAKDRVDNLKDYTRNPDGIYTSSKPGSNPKSAKQAALAYADKTEGQFLGKGKDHKIHPHLLAGYPKLEREVRKAIRDIRSFYGESTSRRRS